MGALAFPKASLWFLSFIFLVPFFVSLQRVKSARGSFLLGMTFGLFYFGILFAGLSELYLYVSFFAYAAWLGLVALESSFTGLFALLFYLFFRRRAGGLLKLFAVPATWVVIEWLRSLGEFGVSGGVVGYSLAGVRPLIQVASIFGVFGVSFFLVLINASFFQVIIADGKPVGKAGKNMSSLLIAVAVLALVLIFGACRLSFDHRGEAGGGMSLRATLVQGNVDQLTKLSPASKNKVLKKYLDLTRDILPVGSVSSNEVNVIIWPETFVPTYLLYDPSILSMVVDLVKTARCYFLIGAPHFEAGRSYNSAFLFSPGGEVVGRYDKQKMVPFGEYLPFRFIFYPLLSRSSDIFENWYSGNPDPQLLSVPPFKLGLAICFESTFPYLVLQRVRQGADVIVVITNDAWFGRSSLAYQHLDTSVFRSIETGRPLVQVGNTGISAVINPFGRVIRHTELMREGAFSSVVPQRTSGTFYAKFGDVFVLFLLIFVLAVLIRGWLNAR